MDCVKTTSVKKEKRWVIFIGDCLLRGTEGPICRPDPLLREVCCLRGAQVKDVTRKLPTLVWPLDYYPLLIFQVGSDEVATRSLRAIKRGFRTLGQLVRGSGAQAVFSVFPVAGNNEGRNKKRQQINAWLWAWCHQQNLGFFWSWVGLHDTRPAGNRRGMPVSKREKDLCTGVSRAYWRSFKLDLKGERNKTRLARDKPGSSTPMFEGQCASDVLWSAVSVGVGDGDPCSS